MTEYVITRLGHHGDGIAEVNGQNIFAPLTLPNEAVSGEVVKGRLNDIHVLTPSPERVTPACPRFTTCGGCALQHASDEFLADWKRDEVRRALGRLGEGLDIRMISVSPPRSRRRATIAARRTKKGVLLGFHGRASGVISDIEPCVLVAPEIVAARPALEKLVRLGASRKGEVSLAVTVSRAGLDVAVRGVKPLDGPLGARLAEAIRGDKIARLVWNDEIVATFSAPFQTFGIATVVPPPGAFLQATLEGQVALVEAVTEIIGPAKRVADLFAGCGTFALSLAGKAAVHAIESEASLVAALMDGAHKSPALKPVTSECRDLFRRPLLADELTKFDAVVIDPPRAGAAAQVEMLSESTVRKIAYVSCNPATFTRDATHLIQGGYHLEWVRVVDQFRWSHHIELVANFSRVRASV